MSKDSVSPVDENLRRYYLDAMGIQCWQALESEPMHSDKRGSGEVAEAASQVASQVGSQAENLVVGQVTGQVRGEAEAVSWPQIENAVQQCDKCPLHKTSKRRFAGMGNPSAELMFVLLSPDIMQGDKAEPVICNDEPRALLSKMLAAINIQLQEVYITSLLKCAVAASHTVSPQEIHACQLYLKQQIHLIKPKRLIVLGETAARCLMQKNLSLDEYRAMNNEPGVSSAHQFDTVPLFFSYSPQELIAQPENKRKAWLDLQQLQKML